MLDDETLLQLLRSLEQEKHDVECYLERLNKAIAAIRSLPGSSLTDSTPESTTTSGTIPPIRDIFEYLAQQAGPVHQNQIIHAVGEIRQKRYPSLSNHYASVWRALEYHVRHGRLACVDGQGRTAELKPLPPRPKGRKLHNTPALYEQDNWFMLRPAEGTVNIMPHGEATGHSLFRQE